MFCLEADVDAWTLKFADLEFIRPYTQSAWLDIALKVVGYRHLGTFVDADQVEQKILRYLADQLNLPEKFASLSKRSARSDRERQAAVRNYLGIVPMTDVDLGQLSGWLESDPNFAALGYDDVEEKVFRWCVDRSLMPPNGTWIARMHRSLQTKVDEALFHTLFEQLEAAGRERLLKSIAGKVGPSLAEIRHGAGRVSRENFQLLSKRLRFVHETGILDLELDTTPTSWREPITRRVAKLDPWELKRMKAFQQVGMYAVFLHARTPDLTDSLVDALVDAVFKFRKRAERVVGREIAKQAERVYDKERLLKDILAKALEDPAVPIGEAVFSLVSPSDARRIVEDAHVRGTWANDVFAQMKRSWSGHYRPMLRELLETVTFYTNNARNRVLINALDWVHLNARSKRQGNVYTDTRNGAAPPIDGIVPNKYRPAVVANDGTLDKHAYELCVVLALRDALRSRELWVPGSRRYKNPAQDVPQDFEVRRDDYYRRLGLTQEPNEFTNGLRAELESQLLALNDGLPRNRHVQVTAHPKWLIARYKPAPEPVQLTRLKAEIGERWPMTGLVDMLKETALDTGFLRELKTAGRYTNINRGELDLRLMLCLYGLGTNAGLKRIASASSQATYDQLIHVRRRFIDPQGLREANQRVSNAILRIRDPQVWGEMGTACASDSKQYAAYDQNPLAEWHMRYGGRGIMVYWHVERKSMCIYSRLKKVSASEVASMIEGVLHHKTDMDIDRHYTDSHGQTEVAFAFCHLLGFDLAPRIKRIAHQKLSVPSAGMLSRLGDIRSMCTRPIDWTLIERQYDELVKYATAMREGTTDPETVLRRFTRASVQHPTYRALAELGRAVKTIFVCRYLRFEEFRREIHEGLNVMENWNSATKFVHFGRAGEFSSNRREDQEVGVQALHLLQNCMVYVNTQMYQSVLSEPTWASSMKAEDYRGITPLVYAHVNPYGRFDLNLEDRLSLSTT